MVWLRKIFVYSYLIQFLDIRVNFNIMDYRLFIYLYTPQLPLFRPLYYYVHHIFLKSTNFNKSCGVKQYNSVTVDY